MGGMKELWMEEQAAYDDSDYEYWHFLKSYVPDEPFARYRNSVERLDEIAENSKHLNDYPMFHRMMLVQHVAILEAYLADRLITLVTAFPDLRRSLVLNHQPLKAQKYPLEAIVANPELLTDKITSYLKSLLYHELEFISEVYRAALAVDILAEEPSATALKEAMIDRHHCVHRDGKDNDGKVMTQVDAGYIARIRDSSVALVNHIEANCQTWTTNMSMPDKRG
jgi:hypothetical protein